MRKAEDATRFVPGMTRCEVVERRSPERFTREVDYEGRTLREDVTLTPPLQVLFERPAGTEEAGWIANTLSVHEDGRLVLTFTVAVRFLRVEEGSAAEEREAERLRSVYRRAIASTLDTVRALALDDDA